MSPVPCRLWRSIMWHVPGVPCPLSSPVPCRMLCHVPCPLSPVAGSGEVLCDMSPGPCPLLPVAGSEEVLCDMSPVPCPLSQALEKWYHVPCPLFPVTGSREVVSCPLFRVACRRLYRSTVMSPVAGSREVLSCPLSRVAGSGEVVSDAVRLQRDPQRLPAERAEGRRPAELLPRRDAQVPLPPLFRRLGAPLWQVGVQHGGSSAAYPPPDVRLVAARSSCAQLLLRGGPAGLWFSDVCVGVLHPVISCVVIIMWRPDSCPDCLRRFLNYVDSIPSNDLPTKLVSIPIISKSDRYIHAKL